MTEHHDGHGHLCECPADADHAHCLGTDAVIDQGEAFLHRILLAEDTKTLTEVSDRERAVERARKAGGSVRHLGAGLYAVKTGGREHRTSLDPPSCDCETRGKRWCIHRAAVWLITQKEAVSA